MGTINLLHGIYINKLKIIKNDKGEVLKALDQMKNFLMVLEKLTFLKSNFSLSRVGNYIKK